MAGYSVTLERGMGSIGTILRKESLKWEPLGQFRGAGEQGIEECRRQQPRKASKVNAGSRFCSALSV